ncbi:hypothetical protein BC830DRAFT_1151277, partial [Chytriomyces sp. MP71]
IEAATSSHSHRMSHKGDKAVTGHGKHGRHPHSVRAFLPRSNGQWQCSPQTRRRHSINVTPSVQPPV